MTPCDTVSTGLLALTRSGALHAAIPGSGLFRREPDGAWTSLPIPADLFVGEGGAASAAFALAGENLWVVATPEEAPNGGSTEAVLLRTGAPPTETQDVTWPDQRADWERSMTRPRAGYQFCETHFVLLFAFTKVTPADYDFPLTRAALRGHTELSDVRLAITKDHGKRFFGAFPPTFAMGKALVELVSRKMKDARPVLLCVAPDVVRDVKDRLGDRRRHQVKPADGSGPAAR